MNFDVYYPTNKGDDCYVPSVKPHQTKWADIEKLFTNPDVAHLIDRIRKENNKELKKGLPAICFSGLCRAMTTRKMENMVPTNFVMLDVDNCEEPFAAWKSIAETIESRKALPMMMEHVALVHRTPSGKGLRLVIEACNEDLTSYKDQQGWMNNVLNLQQYGKVDEAVSDISRLSFVSTYSDIYYIGDVIRKEYSGKIIIQSTTGSTETPTKTTEKKAKDFTPFTEQEQLEYPSFTYRGNLVTDIIKKYVEVYGEPGAGEIHQFYNGMVKNFRLLCDNNKRVLLFLLPRFGHSEEECWSQIVSICRVNTLSSLPKSFYFFLKDNGFYQPRTVQTGQLHDYMLSEEDYGAYPPPPYLPPVIKDMVDTAPKDFKLPTLNALLPILGTLTSYVQAQYPYDNRYHTTSFFSIIYAPPGTGKGNVERFMDILFEKMTLRDEVQNLREGIYLRTIHRKADSEKAPDSPHTSLRIIPAKNSEAEFLEKQSDNHGYHMFTYAAEMDSWAKGARAAGGNKDDMIRIAWDNGLYGQAFKSANTFKGTVRLYWNVLICGTIQQIENYFKNVENGLVTRCSFFSIENQEFAEPPVWKKLSKKSLARINSFVERCDANSYEEPCEVNIEDLMIIPDDKFDKEVNWRFKFKPRKTVDLSWIMPTINAFHKEQIKLASLDLDRARDVFRRRVAVRGFRLALICTCLWANPRKSDLEKCIPFIDWWMHRDIEAILKLWGEKYNSIADVAPTLTQRSVYASLSDKFSNNDLYAVCIKQGIKTPIRKIVHDWKKLGVIVKTAKNEYEKAKPVRKQTNSKADESANEKQESATV